MDEYISQLSWGGWLSFQFLLGDGNGLEAVQLLEQAAPLGGVQAVDEVARALRRVQRLHGLLLGVRAQLPGAAGGRERQRPPPAAAPGRRAGRGGGGGGRARPQAARGPAPQQRQQPGHGGLRSGDPRGSPGRFRARLSREEDAGLSPTPPRGPPDRQPRRRATCTPRACAAAAASSSPSSQKPATLRAPPTRKTFCEAAGPGELPGRAGGRCGRALPG